MKYTIEFEICIEEYDKAIVTVDAKNRDEAVLFAKNSQNLKHSCKSFKNNCEVFIGDWEVK